jgi:hypothetical protein
MDRELFERLAAFIHTFADAFDRSRADHVIGRERFSELRLELNQLNKATQHSLDTQTRRRHILSSPNARLLHECLCVAHTCEKVPTNIRALMPVCFSTATRDACYVMQQFDNYLIHQRIDALGDTRMRI